MAKKKGLFSWFKKSEETTESQIEQQTEVTEEVTEAVVDDAQGNDTAEHSESPSEPVSAEASSDATESEENAVADLEVEEKQTDAALETEAAEEITDVETVEDVAESESADESKDEEQVVVEQAIAEQADTSNKPGFFQRLKSGLSKTRQNIGSGLFDLFRDKKIDDELFEELETQLLMADVGVETTTKIIDSLTQAASRSQLKDAEALYELLKQELQQILDGVEDVEAPAIDGPKVILMVGVNGVGKTTTIGKLAKQFQAEGKSVMLAAGDTFRAAAVEQLQVWGERNDIPVVAQHTGADSASVIFDALNSAKSRNVDVLIADTAGRLQNKAHLMEELKKVVRVMKKIDADAPHEIMLTIDAGTGQNALSQTQLFNDAVGLTSLAVTKLDGTAKGGVIFAVADKFKIPIKYLGVGEGIDDLRQFNAKDFIEALFEK
ncbi:signal recognition particle-docking protein FtsY [Thalassotalea sp. PS06]|uniref:signal recognition particle-docking protein FtsY n=1 Tax=Thalassotalea sp. PS06 TaxID=2594005 RepID=UPI0011640286|nr:signal recognition particle-docking protein FtsY [Thalassotalea sp. PS06]QDP02672.1 signal recognition particle-docking protein FtsY [Thalassotalea sp. PS06]